MSSLQGAASTPGAGHRRKQTPSVTGPESFPRLSLKRRRVTPSVVRRSLGDGGRFPECLYARGPLCLRDSGAVAPSAASGPETLCTLPRAHRLATGGKGAVDAWV